MGDEPCDVGPVVYGEVLQEFHFTMPQRHHPAGIEPPELYEQWREMERAKERDLMASCPDVKSYTQACRYMHAEPPKPQHEPFQAEGAVFARLIAKG